MSLVTKREAIRLGRLRGLNAASWVFDGNTTRETYERFLKLWEDGDPALSDMVGETNWLSGEWAGESIPELLGSCDNMRDEERLDDVCQAYEEAADRAFWKELERVARFHTR